ncbi:MULTISPECIES: hypothetical protein [Bacteroidota]|uniref:hypothetical protein n=1 Tax=Bacteroidota TaxID=976 RepID=UPI00257C6C09|nr:MULTISPECIES: hypothetical protein [Bacteroidota]
MLNYAEWNSIFSKSTSKTEIETIIRGTNNPFLKQILKSASFQIVEESMIKALKEENFADEHVKNLDGYKLACHLSK